MKLHPMPVVADALRYLQSQGYGMTEIVAAVHEHKMSVVEIAQAVKELRKQDAELMAHA